MAEQLVWAHVVRPRCPLVYLDLNHFIYLARANNADPRTPAGYKELLNAARVAVDEERLIIPLSFAHLWEMAAINDPRQRQDVANVMEMLSGYRYLLSRVEIARLEIEAGIEAVLGEFPAQLPVQLIGPGFGWAFGMRGGVRVVDQHGNDASEAARRDMGEQRFDALMRYANRTLERQMLAGPSDEEAQVLRASYGYAPEAARESGRSRLAYELDLSDRLAQNPTWRRGRLRDVVSVREITHEILDAINRVNDERARAGHRGLDFDDASQLRNFMAAMPHTQVAISMKTRYHRNPNHRWTTNDITDIDAISVAYAYCDVVFADRAARAAITSSKELRVFPAKLPRTPQELTELIDRLPQLPARHLLVPHPLPW